MLAYDANGIVQFEVWIYVYIYIYIYIDIEGIYIYIVYIYTYGYISFVNVVHDVYYIVFNGLVSGTIWKPNSSI